MIIVISLIATSVVWWFIKIRQNIEPITKVSDDPQRAYSDAEIAAKCYGYWERKSHTADTVEQRSEYFQNAASAFMALVEYTGDFVPKQAQQPIEDYQSDQNIQTLPDNVVLLNPAPGANKP